VNEPGSYLVEIDLALIGSPIILEYQVIRSWSNTDDGYIRFRATLINGDFLEAAEYFIIRHGQIETIDYHYQWMDATKQLLRRRWDSTPHYPELENFPHHIHDGDEDNVIPGQMMSILQLLRYLERTLSQ